MHRRGIIPLAVLVLGCAAFACAQTEGQSGGMGRQTQTEESVQGTNTPGTAGFELGGDNNQLIENHKYVNTGTDGGTANYKQLNPANARKPNPTTASKTSGYVACGAGALVLLAVSGIRHGRAQRYRQMHPPTSSGRTL